MLRHLHICLFACLLAAAVEAADPVKVMPLGDSLTFGSYGAWQDGIGGYRAPLWSRLAAAGYQVDFVGSVNGPAPAGVDPDHEGHPGWRVDEITGQIDGWLASSQPELVLLLIGANDLIQGDSVDTAASRMNTLLDRIFTDRPAAKLLVGNLPGVPQPNSYNYDLAKIQDYNRRLPAMVSARAAQGRDITLVDIYGQSGLTAADFGSDGIHPNDAGYAKMADAWYGPLSARLIVTQPYTPPTPTGTFYRAINLGGGATTIDGHAWEAGSASGVSSTGNTFANQGVALSPATDAARTAMIRCSAYDFSGSSATLSAVPSGVYDVYLYVWEDNNSETVSFTLNGATERTGYATGSAGHWDRLGPWSTTVTGGSIALRASGVANLSGLEVWRTGDVTTPASGGTDLRVSADGHRLQKADGTPFFLLSDTEWLLNAHSDAQVLQILDDRKAKGFTAVQGWAVRSFWGASYGSNTDANGQYPFIDNDATRLNAAYWQRWRWICDRAAERGLHFILVMGEPGRNDSPYRVGSLAAAYAYARQVGVLFAGAANVIFCQGEDCSVWSHIGLDGWRAMAEGVADGTNGVNAYDGQADWSTTTQTFHGYDVSAALHNDAWCDFYGPEVWHDNAHVYSQVAGDWGLGAPVKPTFLMEGSYENEGFDGWNWAPFISADYTRAEGWFSVLGSCQGYGYGNFGNWSQRDSVGYLNDPAAQQMGVLAAFVTSRAWWRWAPDPGMVDDAGSGAAQTVAVRSSAGDEAVLYFPVNAGKVVHLDRITGSTTVSGSWLDPRNGQTATAGTWTAGTTPTITPPSGWLDAVLLLTRGGGNLSPNVSLTAPNGGAAFQTPASIVLAASASDADGTVAKVAFYQGSTKLGEDSSAPYAFTWSNPPAGSYSLTAVATDNGGASATSVAVAITVNDPPPNGAFGVNLNGGAATIDGLAWSSYATALANGLSVSNADTWSGTYPSALSPATDAATTSMLQSVLYRGSPPNGQGITINRTMANGTYDVWVWMVENHQANFRDTDVRLEGQVVATAIGDLPLWNWRKYGPYRTTVADGTLTIDLLRHSKGDPLCAGLLIAPVSSGNQPPSVALSAPAAGASYTAPASIVLTANANDTDGSIAKVAFYQGSTRLGETTSAPYAFTWSNALAGSYSLTAVATDNAGASTTSAAVAITVGDPPSSGAFAVNLNGGAVSIDGLAWSSYATALANGLSISNADAWSGTYPSALSPATDAATTSMLQSVLYRGSPPNGQGITINRTMVNGTYDVWLWMVENYQGNFRDTDVRLEGQTVATAIGDLPLWSWAKYGPFRATVSDGALTIDLLRHSKGDPLCAGLLIAPVAIGGDSVPAPWSTADIGGVGTVGSTSLSGSTWTITGSGDDIWNNADAFRFAAQPLSGDGQITARVVSQTASDGWAKAGVMIRESADPAARQAMTVVTPGNGIAFQRRLDPGGASSHTAGASSGAPYWVRLSRVGNVFTAYQSADGATWVLVGQATITMAASAQIGLAVTSHNNGTTSTAVFDHVTVILSTPGNG